MDYSSSNEESVRVGLEGKIGEHEKGNSEANESNVERVSESSCMKGDKHMHELQEANEKMGDTNVHSKDPFKIYELLNKNKNKGQRNHSVEETLQYPPGFTPLNDVMREKVIQKERNTQGGSILNLMDEIVRVRQATGYKMDGCIENIEAIIGAQ
ncbi:hypothetical protein Tco_0717441 [Tanacetum coccineum]